MNRYIALQRILALGSFTKAANDLGYTQSAISQMISSLEDELSLKLLSRSRTGVKLTPEGIELYPYIEKIVNQHIAMQERVKEIIGLDSGIIRVGTISSVTCNWMPQLMKDFQSMYPNVQFILQQGDYGSIQEWIKNGAVDFGFITPSSVSGIETITIRDDQWLAILPLNHPLATKEKIFLRELVDEEFILIEEGAYSEPLKVFDSCKLNPNVRYFIHDDYAIMTMVEAGLGVSILPGLVLRRANYKIAKIPTEPQITRTLAIGFKDKKILPIASKYFIDFLLSNINNLPY